MPYLIYAPNTPTATTYELHPGCNTLGRAPDNDIVAIQENFSRYHAQILIEGGKFILRDRNSYNGIFVNDARIQQQELHHGDFISCGEVCFQFLTQL
ncbi:MAG: FHA domain-containing protein [Jaaginema sp. PMC 1079.18]|nr:FHA domain-containing protein [Jaaginema sp. PMC 1080.18]MEC4850144.1 FHA domain-containing protein [Jaaginema sp. PMC 1079.18]MEC4866051.1 FHA domain-containing protein [Jaaginema sp. PMC 1078.18]